MPAIVRFFDFVTGRISSSNDRSRDANVHPYASALSSR